MDNDFKLLTKLYQLQPSTFSLECFSSFLSMIQNASITYQNQNNILQNIIIEKDNHLIGLINFNASINFDYTRLYESLVLNEKVARKLRFESKSPYLYNSKAYDKGIYFNNDISIPSHNFKLETLTNESKIKDIIKDLNLVEKGYNENLTPNLFLRLINEKGEKIAFGLASLNHLINEGSILWIEVLKEFQGQNYGSIILNELIFQLKADFVSVCFPESTLFRNFFSKCGFINWTKWYVYSFKPRLLIASYDDLSKKILEISNTKKRPNLLIHSCCGPCSGYVLSSLSKSFNLSLIYYNPNIYPKDEFKNRLKELEKIINYLNLNINLIVPEYNDLEFYQAIKGYENKGEGSIRCFRCYEQRLRFTAIYAKEHGFDYFTTTLSISPYKDALKINYIGQALAQEYKINFLYSNFKLDNGFQKSMALAKKYHLYRQDYCGCIYSKNKVKK